MTTRTRPAWPDLPHAVRGAVEARLGSPVRAWTSHDGGYSPGMASTLRTADGAVFVKAVSTDHAVSADLYRQEAERIAVLPAGVPAPRLLWSLELPAAEEPSSPGWVVLAFETVAHRTPRTPWVEAELAAVLGLCDRIAGEHIAEGVLPDLADELPSDLTARLADERPAGLADFDPWFADRLDRLATLEESARAAVAGDRLVHGDMRGDNVLLHGPVEQPQALAVDWPYANRGAAFADVVGMLPSAHLEGALSPQKVLASHPRPPGTDDDAVNAYLVALTGYWVHASLQPPPPGIPHVRAFQRAQGRVCIDWLRDRLS